MAGVLGRLEYAKVTFWKTSGPLKSGGLVPFSSSYEPRESAVRLRTRVAVYLLLFICGTSGLVRFIRRGRDTLDPIIALTFARQKSKSVNTLSICSRL